MRRLQSLLARLPGGELHHHGQNRNRPPRRILGPKDRRMKAPMPCTKPLPHGRGSDRSRDRKGAVSFASAVSSPPLRWAFFSGLSTTPTRESPQSPLSPPSRVLTHSLKLSASGLRVSASPRQNASPKRFSPLISSPLRP